MTLPQCISLEHRKTEVRHAKVPPSEVDELIPQLPLGLPGAERTFQTLESFPRTGACSPLSNPDFTSVHEVRRGTIERRDPLDFLS